MKSIIAASAFFYVLGLGHSIDYEPNNASKQYFNKNLTRKVEESSQAFTPGSHYGALAEDNYEEIPPYKDQTSSFTSAYTPERRRYGGKGNSIPYISIQADVDKEQNAVVCHKEKKYYDNTINDSKMLNFTSNKITYYLPTSNALLQKWNGLHSFAKTPGRRVTYLRNTTELVLRGKEGNCASTLDVFAWLMDELNKRHLILMIGYGELIHVHREKDFVNSTTGNYIDDDIDTWATLETVAYIGAVEEELFSKFGWSMRAFVTGTNQVIFIQMMATCGHVPVNAARKCRSSQPAIEVYPLPIVDMSDGIRIIKDIWQGSKFAETLIYPPKCITFQSSGRKDPIHLQIPREAIKILNCLYGQWNVKSSKHAGLGNLCRDDTEIV